MEMKVIEILNLNKSLLNVCLEAGVKVDDVRYIDLYNDYHTLVSQGEKVSYIVALLGERYGVSERKVYSVIKRMQTDCKLRAV